MKNIFKDIQFKENYNTKKLRDYQFNLKSEVYLKFSQDTDRILLQMPTASGKTFTFCSIIDDCISYANKNNELFDCLIIVHREELLEQIAQTLKDLGHTYGKITRHRNQLDTSHPIQIAMVGSLNENILDTNHKKRIKLIIIDEAHHAKAPSYQQLYENYPNAKILGLTATPMRMSGDPLNDIFDELIIGPSIRELIETKDLANPIYFAPNNPILLNDIPLGLTGDYSENELFNRFNDENLIKSNIIDAYNKYVRGKKGLVFAINIEHCKLLKNAFDLYGIKSEYIVSDTNDINSNRRNEIVNKFRDGEIKILINRDIFTEGFDCPDAEFVILARPTKSFIVYMQQIGRVLRKKEAPVKNVGYIIDTVNAIDEHPNFIDNIPWDLYFNGRKEDIESFENTRKKRKKILNEIDFNEGVFQLEQIDFELNIKVENDYDIFNYTLIDFLQYKLKDLYLQIIEVGYENENDILKALKVLDNNSIDISIKNFELYIVVKNELNNKYKELVSTEENFQLLNKPIFNENEIVELNKLISVFKQMGYMINDIPELISKNPNFINYNIDVINDFSLNQNGNKEVLLEKIKTLNIEIEKLILKIEDIKNYSNNNNLYKEKTNITYETFEIEKESIITNNQRDESIIDFISKHSIQFYLLDNTQIGLTNLQKNYLNELINNNDKDFIERVKTLIENPEIVTQETKGFGINTVIDLKDKFINNITSFISKDHYNFIKVGRLLNITDDDLLALFNEDYHAFKLLDILLSNFCNLNDENKIYYNYIFNKVGSYNDIISTLNIPDGTMRATINRLRTKLFNSFFNEFSNVYFDKLKLVLNDEEILFYERTENIYMINQEQILLFNQENNTNISIFIIDALLENKFKAYNCLSNHFQGTTYCLQNGYWISDSIDINELKKCISEFVNCYENNKNKNLSDLEEKSYKIICFILYKEGIEYESNNSEKEIKLKIIDTRNSKKQLILKIFKEKGQNGLTIPQINNIIMENNLEFHRDLDEKARLKNITDIVSRGDGDFYIFGLDGRNNVYKLTSN